MVYVGCLSTGLAAGDHDPLPPRACATGRTVPPMVHDCIEIERIFPRAVPGVRQRPGARGSPGVAGPGRRAVAGLGSPRPRDPWTVHGWPLSSIDRNPMMITGQPHRQSRPSPAIPGATATDRRTDTKPAADREERMTPETQVV